MIASNNKTIAGKCARIETPAYQCTVSTAKEGLFLKISTVIAEGGAGTPPSQLHVCGKLIYADALSSEERYNMHDVVSQIMSDLGDRGFLFGDSIQAVIKELKERGVLKEGINVGIRDCGETAGD